MQPDLLVWLHLHMLAVMQFLVWHIGGGPYAAGDGWGTEGASASSASDTGAAGSPGPAGRHQTWGAARCAIPSPPRGEVLWISVSSGPHMRPASAAISCLQFPVYSGDRV